MIYRNVHNLELSELDQMMVDARTYSWRLFLLVYGPEVNRWHAADNSMRVATFFRSPVVSPDRKGDHRTPPRPKDKVVIQEDGEETYGHITWVGNDSVGVFRYDTRSGETFDIDCLETERNGKARWRIA